MNPRISFKDFLFVIFFYFIFAFGLDFIVSFLIKKGVVRAYLGVFELFVVYSVIITIVFLILYRYVNNKSFSELGLKKPVKYDFVLSLRIFFMLFIVAFISRLLDPSFDFYYASSFGLLNFGGAFIFILSLPFFAVKEEIFERSFFQSVFSKGYASLIAPIIVALNFALAHYYNTGFLSHNLNIFLTVFIGTYFIALLYEKTRNIFASAVTHLIYNIVVVFLIYLHANKLLVFEGAVWLIWGILFLVFLKGSLKDLMSLFVKKVPRLGVLDWVYILVFTIVFPILIILFLEGLV